MKKKIGLTIGIITAALVLGLGIYHTDASQTEPKLSADQIRQLVNEQYPGTITEMELDKDFNKVVYEIEIEGNGKKYDLTLDGNSGEVLKIQEKTFIEKKDNNLVVKEKTDLEKHESSNKVDNNVANEKVEKNTESTNVNRNPEPQKSEATKVKSNVSSDKKAVIDISEASAIALNAFAGKITEIELDEEDGRLIYEIEIKAGNQEADIDIDAYTGEILVIEIDD